MNLLLKAFAKCILGVICMGAVLFLPAGTLHYPGAWLLAAILFIPMAFLGLFLSCKAPELLKKRLNTKEKNTDQKRVIILSSLLFVGVFVLSGLDFRFGWSNLPPGVVTFAVAMFFVGYGLYAEVMRENAYLSRTVEVQEGQKVICTGLYGRVRHPMYVATILLFFAMPLVLGSIFACFLMLVGYLPILTWRIRDEEKTLVDGLPGYREYMVKVKYRLFPLIW